ncbi:hypothetical protein [Actinoplanes sp. GCM10030250]|uniref:hypothetical protein n=1 Tax=Actinoplanes sp. GCM10030250 TaxID=3273376 RepID=UPI003672281F
MDEKRISDAYEAIAALAPTSHGLEARITARARAHRQRRLLLTAGAATAVAAVGVPLTLKERRPETAPAGAPSVIEAPLMFTPSWFPDGVTEQYRSVRFDTATGPEPGVVAGAGRGAARSWLPPGVRADTEGPGLVLYADDRLGDDSGEPVDIAGRPGTLQTGDTVQVCWKAGPDWPGLTVAVQGLPDPVDVALRVARSTIHSSALMNLSMSSPWVPGRFTGGTTTATVFPAAAGGWQQSLLYCSADYLQTAEVVVRTGPPPASVIRWLAGPGVSLYVTGNSVTGAEAGRLIEELRWTTPDLSWVGDR